MLFVGVGRQEAESGPGLQGEMSARMRRRHDRPAPFGEEVRDPCEDAPRLGDVLEDGEKQNDVEWPPRGEGRWGRAGSEIPFEEIRRRKSRALQAENLRIPVTARVRREAPRQIRQAAADV